MAWSPTFACIPRRPSRWATFQGSSSRLVRSATASPGPVATMSPVCTCWESIAVGGRERPTRVRSSPSSGVMRTRSPTTRSCFLGNSMNSSGGSLPVSPALVRGHQLHDPELPGCRGEAKADLVTHPPVREGASEGGCQGDVAGIEVHHLGEHDHVSVPVVGVEIDDRHGGAEPDPIGRGLVIGELTELAEPLVKLAEPGLDELLPLERRLILGILPQVAQLDRLGNGLGQKDVQFVAELIDLTAQLFPHFTDHGRTRLYK